MAELRSERRRAAAPRAGLAPSAAQPVGVWPILLQDCSATVSALPERPGAESLITVRQICFSAALISAALPEPATSHRWLSWVFSSDVRAAVASRWISALQTATTAAPPPPGIAELGVVLLVVELALVEVLGVELVLVVLVDVAALDELLLLLEVVAAALVVLALLVVVVLGLLPPQPTTSAPLTIAPASSRYSLRVIVHPLIVRLRNLAGSLPHGVRRGL